MEKACVNFLNVTMDICYKTFFYFAKHKDKRTKNNLEKKKETTTSWVGGGDAEEKKFKNIECE